MKLQKGKNQLCVFRGTHKKVSKAGYTVCFSPIDVVDLKVGWDPSLEWYLLSTAPYLFFLFFFVFKNARKCVLRGKFEAWETCTTSPSTGNEYLKIGKGETDKENYVFVNTDHV